MKKKLKFMTIYLREDEWEEIKIVMKLREEALEGLLSGRSGFKCFIKKEAMKHYNLVYHFNHIGIDNIEDLARKEERRRKRDKSNKKKS